MTANTNRLDGMDMTDELINLLREIRPNFSDVGSRDVDTRRKQKQIDRAIELLSASKPAATSADTQDERGALPSVCDGKEQDEFEAWAAKEKFDMACHPLHWLFLNERTDAARQGWKAALEYVNRAAATSANVAQGAEPTAYKTLLDALGYPWLPCPICNGTEGCDHSYPERARVALATPPTQTENVVPAATVQSGEAVAEVVGPSDMPWVRVVRTGLKPGDKLYLAAQAAVVLDDARALTDEQRDAARYRWLRERTDARDQKPFIARMQTIGIALWNDTSADDLVDAAMHAEQAASEGAHG